MCDRRIVIIYLFRNCSVFVGETKECSEFAKNFLERRSKYKNQQRAANAHIDDMCSPAPAITPANESQDTKVYHVATTYFSKH